VQILIIISQICCPGHCCSCYSGGWRWRFLLAPALHRCVNNASWRSATVPAPCGCHQHQLRPSASQPGQHWRLGSYDSTHHCQPTPLLSDFSAAPGWRWTVSILTWQTNALNIWFCSRRIKCCGHRWWQWHARLLMTVWPFSNVDAPCGDMLELRICFCFFIYMLELFA